MLMEQCLWYCLVWLSCDPWASQRRCGDEGLERPHELIQERLFVFNFRCSLIFIQYIQGLVYYVWVRLSKNVLQGKEEESCTVQYKRIYMPPTSCCFLLKSRRTFTAYCQRQLLSPCSQHISSLRTVFNNNRHGFRICACQRSVNVGLQLQESIGCMEMKVGSFPNGKKKVVYNEIQYMILSLTDYIQHKWTQ